MIKMDDQDKLQIPGLHHVDGVPMIGAASVENLAKVRQMEVYKGDVFVCSYPKSGTVWTGTIVAAILSADNLDQFVKDGPQRCDMGSIEREDTFQRMASVERPAIYKSHLYFHQLPEELADEDKANVIYVMRNPKDVAVSYYHMCKAYNVFGAYKGTWSAFLETYLAGGTPWGSWFDHVKKWLPYLSRRNVTSVVYEDAVADPQATIKQLAGFLGKALTDDQVERIAEITSAKFMKKTSSLQWKPHDCVSAGDRQPENIPFIRKAVTGDWMNYFSEEENAKFEALYERFVKETGLKFQFEYRS